MTHGGSSFSSTVEKLFGFLSLDIQSSLRFDDALFCVVSDRRLIQFRSCHFGGSKFWTCDSPYGCIGDVADKNEVVFQQRAHRSKLPI